MAARPVRTAWHPLLVLLLKQLLPADGFEVTGEFSLTREPLRLDVVVVRKKADARPLFHLLPSLLDGLLPHTLISFKGPTDELEGEDATMLLAYSSLYLAVAGVADPRQVAPRVVAAQLTPRFREQLDRLGGDLRYDVGGVWNGKLGPFSLRAIETERAFSYEEEHLWYAFSPSLLARRRHPTLAQIERTFYQYIYQQIAHVRAQGDPLMYKDLDLAKMSLEEAMTTMMEATPIKLRLAGLAPEQVGEELGREWAVLALPDDLLKVQPDEVLNSLSPGARERVRQRIGR